ncbi:MAG: hypothetical protein ACK4NT_07430, partial [Candidatus Omnitrophota bacterium]
MLKKNQKSANMHIRFAEASVLAILEIFLFSQFSWALFLSTSDFESSPGKLPLLNSADSPRVPLFYQKPPTPFFQPLTSPPVPILPQSQPQPPTQPTFVLE